MKNLLVLFFLIGGFAIADAQTCKTPCPPQCCISACCPVKGSAVSASLLPAGEQTTPVCTPAQMASCTPAQMAACLDALKMSKKDLKACQKACDTKSKSACVAPAAASTHSTEKQVDRMYHTVPSPSKS